MAPGATRTKRPIRWRAITHAVRRAICAKHGVANTGRQWRQLRKRLGLLRRDPLTLTPWST